MLISKFVTCNIEEKIESVERKYEIVFSEQYKDFLIRYNGGYTPKTKFKAGKISSDVRGFLGFGDVKLSIDTIEMEEWLEKNVFPVGCDSFGNYIVIGVGNENFGKIYFCNHEKENEIENITTDFNGFISICKSEKISDASRRSIREREEALIAKGRGHIITDELRRMWQEEIDKFANMIQEEVIIK